MTTFTIDQVQALLAQAQVQSQALLAHAYAPRPSTSPPPRSGSGSVVSQPLTSALFNQSAPALARSLLNQADQHQCFVLHTEAQEEAPPSQEQVTAALQALQTAFPSPAYLWRKCQHHADRGDPRRTAGGSHDHAGAPGVRSLPLRIYASRRQAR